MRFSLVQELISVLFLHTSSGDYFLWFHWTFHYKSLDVIEGNAKLGVIPTNFNKDLKNLLSPHIGNREAAFLNYGVWVWAWPSWLAGMGILKGKMVTDTHPHRDSVLSIYMDSARLHQVCCLLPASMESQCPLDNERRA